jgi:hypothetical protein
MPEANRARSDVRRLLRRAFGLEVGFDSAKMTGRSLMRDISRTTFSVNVPGTAPTPMMTVGRNDCTAPMKSLTGACACA